MFDIKLATLLLTVGVSSTNVFHVEEKFFAEPPTESYVSIVMAGDNLIHKPIIPTGVQEDGSYNYSYMYENVSDYINGFDIRILNQETPLVSDRSKYSGYPQFGSPVEIGDAVVDAGFNVISQATNHSIDKGVEGVTDSYEFWKEHGVPVLGIHLSEDEDSVYYYECNGIKIAFLNYTYGLNGLSLPTGYDYMVDTFSNKDKIASDLAAAEDNADITIVVAHWGDEYVYSPTAWQRNMAEFLIDNGADLILGRHPHVIEPIEWVESNGAKVPVYWSLGNFLSGQSEVPRMLGMLAEVTICKNKDGEVYIVEATSTPTVTHISTYSEKYEVYLLSDYTEELCETHRLRRTRGNEMSIGTLRDLWYSVMK